MPAKRFRPRSITPGMALRRAIAIVDTSPELTAIASAMTADTGRPRKMPFRTVLIGMMLHAILDGTNMHLTRVADHLAELPPDANAKLEITAPVAYHHVQQAIRKLRHHIESQQLVLNGAGGTRQLSLDDVIAAALDASLPPNLHLPQTVALDGFDYETPARPEEYVDKRTGEVWPSADPDARRGHRTRTPNHDSEYFVGYEVHVLTSTADRPTRRKPMIEVPHVIRAMTLRPGISDRGSAGADLICAHARRSKVTTCLVDRGYTQLRLTQFRLPVLEAGVDVVMDLKSNQRTVRNASTPGVLLIDGHPFISAIPEHLRQLQPPKLSDSAATKAQIHSQYDARRPYALTPHTKVDPVTGTQRFKGPALRGHVRCPNDPRSVRMPRKIPPTTCTPGQPCACAKVVTLQPDDDLQTRQTYLYGTTAWKAAYSLRVAIESTNAEARNHRANINRGYTRVFGRTATGLLLAFGMAGLNVRILHDWHESRGLPDPWGTTLAEPPDERPRQRRPNKIRKLTLLERLTTGADPPIGPRPRH